ncbi:30S ribosomal protein S21, partial [bacterium]|nr:30S ribosomal protein S21 [bacterium]
KRQIEKGGVLSDFKKKEFFEKPSEIKKKKLFAAKKRQNKKNRKFR